MKCLQVKLNQVLDVVQKMKENSCETKRSVFKKLYIDQFLNQHGQALGKRLEEEIVCNRW